MRFLAIVALATSTLFIPALATVEPVLGQTAPAAPTAPAAAPVASADQSSSPELDRVVCRSNPAPTGSRLGGTRECHSVREWNERTAQDQRMLQKIQVTQFHSKGG